VAVAARAFVEGLMPRVLVTLLEGVRLSAILVSERLDKEARWDAATTSEMTTTAVSTMVFDAAV
jgi:hypothetical protein